MSKVNPKSAAARDRFLSWVADNGFSLRGEVTWAGSAARYPATCPVGHKTTVCPNSVQQGHAGCRFCAAKATQAKATSAACDRFLSWVSDNGFTLDEPFEWKGVRVKYGATCHKGHRCNPRPDTIAARGLSGCEPCSYEQRGLLRKDSKAARLAFIQWIADNGYTLSEPFEWKGVELGYAATCPQGHACAPWPISSGQGRGGCGACKGKVWDAFYVVHNVEASTVKFGITSGNPKPRLADHRRAGFTAVLRVFAGLPEGEARGLEQQLLKVLHCAGVQPLQRREYFPDATLNVVLPFVDEWLS